MYTQIIDALCPQLPEALAHLFAFELSSIEF